MLSRISELFQKPKTKVGGRITPEYTASARYSQAVTSPQNLLRIDTAKQWHYDSWPEVEVGRLYPIINVKLYAGGMVDTRWFLRRHDAIAYVVGLRLEYSDLRGIEQTLEKLSSC